MYVYSDSYDGEEVIPVEPEISLRDHRTRDASQHALWAYLDTKGRLHIDGQDLGPVTKVISDDGEYEYFLTIAKEDIPRLIKLLGGKRGDDILELLKNHWTGKKSYILEAKLSRSRIPVVCNNYY